MPQIIPSFFNFNLFFLLIIVKTISIFPGGSTGKIIGRGKPNVLLFILYREG